MQNVSRGFRSGPQGQKARIVMITNKSPMDKQMDGGS